MSVIPKIPAEDGYLKDRLCRGDSLHVFKIFASLAKYDEEVKKIYKGLSKSFEMQLVLEEAAKK